MSYLHEIQSRGVGAVAARDFGNRDSTQTKYRIGTARTKKQPVLITRRHPHERQRKPFVPRKVGVAVPPPRRTVIAHPKYPPRRTGPVIKPAIPQQQPVVFTETIRVGVPPTGILPGRPPVVNSVVRPVSKKFAASHTPQGPTLATAVAKKNMAQDAMAAKEQIEAELQVPEVTPSRKPLIIGGAIVAVISGLYLYSRSKR